VKKTKIESKNTLSFWKPVLLSIVITPLFLLIALGSGGVGHGTYGAVLLIFPFASLSAVVLDRFFDATLVMILMAFSSFPLTVWWLESARESTWSAWLWWELLRSISFSYCWHFGQLANQ
jgi:hypothetical protein